MAHLIRFVQIRGASREVRNLQITADRATLGRGTDQTIQIADRRVPLEHSILTFEGSRVHMRANSSLTFLVNNQMKNRADLEEGDVVDVVGHEIHVLEESGEIVLEIYWNELEREPLRNKFKTRLWQLEIPVRTFSWALFMLVMVVGIVIPATGFLAGMPALRNSPFPDDSIWLAGDLTGSHAFMGNQCENCHTEPFVAAKDVDCLGCHQSVGHHFDVQQLGKDYFVGDTCQDCHREHNGPDGIVRRDQGSCAACHEDLSNAGYESDLRPVTDFLENHPGFKVSMLTMQEHDLWRVERFEIANDQLAEYSNLKFPHDIHLSPGGVLGPDGEIQMECADCHSVERGGGRIKPVAMEQHCARCHELTFDPGVPDRLVPHGDSDELISFLNGFYAYQYFQEKAAPGSSAIGVAPDPPRDVRRPGHEDRLVTEFQREMPRWATSAEEHEFIDQRVEAAMNRLLRQRTCVVCHELVEEMDGSARIVPVKLASEWMPLAEFSHDSHLNMSCEGCHAAASSDKAEDVLMPDIGSCRTCHGGEHAEDRLKSTCISCHNFHQDNQEPMGLAITNDQPGLMNNQFASDSEYEDESVLFKWLFLSKEKSE